MLIPKADDQMTHPRRVYLVELLIGQGSAQVNAEDLGAYGGGEWLHLDRLQPGSVVGHLRSPVIDCSQTRAGCRWGRRCGVPGSRRDRRPGILSYRWTAGYHKP